MSLLERLKKRLEYEDKKERFLLRPFHSGFYHRQFEGYTEYRRKDQRGRYKFTRVYTGQYYEASVPDKQFAARKFCYSLLYSMTLLFFLRGTITDIPINRDPLLNVITAVSVPVVFGMALGLGSYAFAKRRMTIPVFKAGPKRLKTSALVAAILSGVRLVAILFYCLAVQNGFSGGDIQVLLYATFSGVCALLVNRLEASTRYVSIENPVKPELDGIEIH